MPSRNITDSPTPEELHRRERDDKEPVTRGEFRPVRDAVLAMRDVVVGSDPYHPDPNSFVSMMKDHATRIASLEAQRATHRKITWAALTGAATAAGAAAWSFLTAKH